MSEQEVKKEKGKKEKQEKKDSSKEKDSKKKAPPKDLPEFVKYRLKLWDEIEARQTEEDKKKPRTPIKITLPDGKQMDGVANETTPLDIATRIHKQLGARVVAAKVDEKVTDVWQIGRAVQQECRDRSRMPSSA
eukprot:TRINITY_DN18588_c0_g1_i2.p1 TRINITY_DN18588_c0_g1~~TRINITY_DN18588_c0_g1_i2.p1  ORF type:complete len:134 (+),score=43.70 TRINITY_DN18588_c0_g1_i2:105-506(+)